jgi:ElaB/YqjD/DUF883 family membrane-anchored ribosome-binding protein
MSETIIATTGRTVTEHGFKSEAQRLGQDVGRLHDDLAEIGKDAGATAQSGVATAKAEVENAIAGAKRKGAQATASLRDHAARHPAATLGIAVGVGILIGVVGWAVVQSRRRTA